MNGPEVSVVISVTSGRRLMLPAGVIIVCEVMAVLVLRAHSTRDVVTGSGAGRYARLLASQIAPRCDSFLRRVVRQSTTTQEATLSEMQLDSIGSSSREGNSAE